MRRIPIFTLSLVAASLGLAAASYAAEGSLPGDGGRLGSGIFDPNAPQRPRVPLAPVPRPSLELALAAARAIADGCKQYPLGVAVVNAHGEPVLTYIPDRSNTGHAYTAIRKAYSALTFNSSTADIAVRANTDPDLAARIKADPNLMSYSGGVLLKAGDRIVGAIGVSGAEPGHHDDECARIGVAEIKDRLR